MFAHLGLQLVSCHEGYHSCLHRRVQERILGMLASDACGEAIPQGQIPTLIWAFHVHASANAYRILITPSCSWVREDDGRYIYVGIHNHRHADGTQQRRK